MWRPGSRSARKAWTRAFSSMTDSPPGATNWSKSLSHWRWVGESWFQAAPSSSPKSSSRSRVSAVASRPASCAVSWHRRRSEVQACAGCEWASSLCSAPAWSRPRSERIVSVHPLRRPLAVQSVSPWRTSQISSPGRAHLGRSDEAGSCGFDTVSKDGRKPCNDYSCPVGSETKSGEIPALSRNGKTI